MNANSRRKWGGGIVALLAIVALIAFLWRAGLTRASAIASVAVLVVAIATLVAPYLFPVKSGGELPMNAARSEGSEGQMPAPANPALSGPATVPASTDVQTVQSGGSSSDPSAAHGAQRRSAQERGALPAMDGVIRRVLDLLIAAHLTQGESKQIAGNAGIDFHEVAWSADDALFWGTVLQRAHTAWTMERLFAAADRVFGDNPAWLAAKQDYLTARDGGSSG
jgi:hypothetical protein